MRKFIILVLGFVVTVSCGEQLGNDRAQIIALERAALDRWGRGDVRGYLEIDAPEVTYFDPNLDRRIDGRDAMTAYLTPFNGKIGISHYEMIGPKVQQYGDVAVLSYNLVDDVTRTPDGAANLTIRWNCTEVYVRGPEGWRIAHNHWSYTKGATPAR